MAICTYFPNVLVGVGLYRDANTGTGPCRILQPAAIPHLIVPCITNLSQGSMYGEPLHNVSISCVLRV